MDNSFFSINNDDATEQVTEKVNLAFGLTGNYTHCCPKPEDVDVEHVVVYEDREGFRQRVTQYRFAYQTDGVEEGVDGKLVPLTVSLEKPCFSGKEIHPFMPRAPHHQYDGLFASASNLNVALETKITMMLNKLAEKCGIELREYSFMTANTTVYSTKFEHFLGERFKTIDALISLPVNGVLVQPRFVLVEETWHCHCLIVLACVA